MERKKGRVQNCKGRKKKKSLFSYSFGKLNPFFLSPQFLIHISPSGLSIGITVAVGVPVEVPGVIIGRMLALGVAFPPVPGPTVGLIFIIGGSADVLMNMVGEKK